MNQANDKPSREAIYAFIPWHAGDLWQEANMSLSLSVQRRKPHLTEAETLAKEILADLTSTFEMMDDLCRQTCPGCPDPCCRVAKLWYDFRDLAFLHLNGIFIPDSQPLASYDESCRYLGPRGCRLPRQSRPFICTYYLCPAQTARLRRTDKILFKQTDRLLEKIKTNRKKLEELFVQGISKGASRHAETG